MKQNISRLFVTLRYFVGITFAVLICTFQPSAQQGQQPIDFPIGAFLSEEPGQGVLASFDTSGLNTVSWRANDNTSSFLENYKVWANNGGWTDWIHYYATCYYSRWEGEHDTTIEHIGVKHKYGQRAVWQDTVTCWSSLGVTVPVCSLMYGPHYRQDQRYKSYYHTGDIWGVDYVPRFNMALNNPYSLDSTRNICVIKVVYRYAEIDPSIPPPNNYTVHDTIFLQDTLKIANFPQDGSFKIFNVVENGANFYRYPEKFQSAITGDRVTMSPTYPDLPDPPGTEYIYSDHNNDNGIQFWVDYLGNDSTTLFIDWAEVYDNRGWNYYIDDPDEVEDSIQAYTQRYSDWDNIIYWYGQDEPYSQDSFTPIRIIDSLVQHFGGVPVTQYFQPDWHIVVNGDTFMVDYYRKAKPPELIIDPYPFGPVYYPVRVEDLESLRQEF